MTAYILATVTINDPTRFKAYADAISGLAERFGGTYLLRGPVIEAIEGEVPAGERVVLLQFPDAAAARDYIRSPEYQSGKRLREGAAAVTMRLI